MMALLLFINFRIPLTGSDFFPKEILRDQSLYKNFKLHFSLHSLTICD